MATKWSEGEATFGGCAILAAGGILGGILGWFFAFLIGGLWGWHTGDPKDSIIAWPLMYVCMPVGGLLGILATTYLMNRYHRRSEKSIHFYRRGEQQGSPVVHGDRKED